MDPNFTPGSDEYEQQLFQEQQDFLYSVLISSLKTDFSEAIVKDHEGDAQLILELLHEHHTGNSQYSRAKINRITKYLTNIELDDTWRGTNESFLMHYNEQLRLLDSLVDSDEKLPDNTRVTFLESAVESVPDLRRVKITDNVLQAQLDSTRPISYRSYFDLLKDAAIYLDQATKRGNKIRRTNAHFSGPNDEDEHQNPSSDVNQVIHQEDVYSELPEPLSYSLFLSHFQGSSTSNTQKIFLPKPIWEKLSKDQQQMIIDHNRSLPKGGSSHLSTPNKSPSPLPHKPTPQQRVKSQQVHTHQSNESTADTTKIETTSSDPLLAMVHQSINTSDDDASDITKVLSAKRSRQIQVCKHYLFQHANHTNNQLVDRGANGGLAGSDMRFIYKTHHKINIQGIDNHEVTGFDVVTAATLFNTSLGNEKKSYWVGFADNQGYCLTWRILTEDTQKIIIILEFEVPSELQQSSVLHRLQGRGPHFLFPFLILNNLQILCHLTLLRHQPPILSTLSTVSLVKMKIIQSPWPTLTFPIFLADPSFYHLRIMGSATWPKSLTLMTMDSLLKTLNSS